MVSTNKLVDGTAKNHSRTMVSTNKLVDGTAKNKAAFPAEPTAPGQSPKRGIFGWFAKTLPQHFFESLKKALTSPGTAVFSRRR